MTNFGHVFDNKSIIQLARYDPSIPLVTLILIGNIILDIVLDLETLRSRPKNKKKSSKFLI